MWGVFGEVGVTGGDLSLLDPTMERMVGRKASPWNTPYNTVSPKTLKKVMKNGMKMMKKMVKKMMKTLKKVMKTWEAEKGRMMTASKVVMPAFTMAGPRVTKAS